jgi:hypothetical protein
MSGGLQQNAPGHFVQHLSIEVVILGDGSKKRLRHWRQEGGGVTLYAISLCHALIFPSLLPYLYDRTALPQSTGLTSAVAAISILSSLFP